ncbi:unnamed protein product [Rhizoctonia solani]|uniref:Uncharacterized protein n=1 Tax=Rhizoctonia solani TaxID=456999 RepID=A0A8H3CR57_9AGAM|nr:unnamed protein product [Rhizoctonia solani]
MRDVLGLFIAMLASASSILATAIAAITR